MFLQQLYFMSNKSHVAIYYILVSFYDVILLFGWLVVADRLLPPIVLLAVLQCETANEQ